ncbi:MAG: acetyl ornithine aminotransferase family protein [Desulfurococcales archaeon]|nr:acetyl ornithine aminotransferase family protein [Desulfurococcales archaeon]
MDDASAPYIRIEPPGPKARELIKLDEENIMQSFTRWYPLVVKTAYGSIVEDVDGNRYIDFNSGLVVVNVGHRHPKVVEAIKKQVDKLIHYSLTDFYYEEAARAALRLKKIAPIGDGKVFFTNSGAESIEAAIKISRGYYKSSRPYILSFIGGFHGRTYGAMSVSASKPVHRRGFSPLLPGIIHIPYPNPYRCPFAAETPSECSDGVIGFMEEYIFKHVVDPVEVSAIIFEPIQGEGGYVVPPDDFFWKLEKLVKPHGILMVDDEIQAGFGRTGKWFAIEHWGVEPDLVAMAKGIASGLPLGAVVGKRHLMTLPRGSHANTFGGNPVALAAFNAVVDIIISENLLEKALRDGEYIMRRLNELAEEVELIGDIRGKGLMIGVELVKDRDTKEPAVNETSAVIQESFKKGLLVVAAGYSTIRIAPPLTIERDLIDKGLEILEESLKAVGRVNNR